MADTEAAAAAPEDSDDVMPNQAGGDPSWVDDGWCAVCGGTCDDTWGDDEDDWDDRDDDDWDEGDPDWEVLAELATPPGGPDPDVPDPDVPDPDVLGHVGCPPALPFAVVRTDEEVLDHICALVAGDRGGPFTIWIIFLDGDGTVLPAAMPIDDVPHRPAGREVDGVLTNVRLVLTDATSDGSAVVALVRRGGGDRGDLEIAWTRALTESAGRVGVRLRAVVAVGQQRARILFAGAAT